jgi:hypothetical protein
LSFSTWFPLALHCLLLHSFLPSRSSFIHVYLVPMVTLYCPSMYLNIMLPIWNLLSISI